jgi:hypothetical protein
MCKCECIEKLFCCNFSHGFAHWKTYLLLVLSFRLFYNYKQFRSRFVAFVGLVPGLKQLLNDVFVKKQSSISLGFLHNFSKKNGQLGGSFCWRFYRDCWICDAHKMLYYLRSKRNRDFCQSCILVRFLVNTATFWEKCGFLISLW